MIKTLLVWIGGACSKEIGLQPQWCGYYLTYFDSLVDVIDCVQSFRTDLQPSWLPTYPSRALSNMKEQLQLDFSSSSGIATINSVSCFWQTIEELSILYLCYSVHSLMENLECQLSPERFVSLEYLGTGLGCLWNFNKSVFHFLKTHSFPSLSQFSPVSHTLFWLLI